MRARIPTLPLLAGLACLLALTMSACGQAASHAGQFLVVGQKRGGPAILYSLDAKQGQPNPLTDATSSNWSPVWSLDGESLVFASDRDGQAELYRMNADGSGQTRLTHSQMDSRS